MTYNLFTVTHDLCPVTFVLWPLTSVLHNPGLGDGWVGHGVGQGPHVLGELLKLLPLLALDGWLKRVQVLEVFEFGLHCLNLGPQQHDLLVLLLNLNTSSLGNISHTKISLEQCWSKLNLLYFTKIHILNGSNTLDIFCSPMYFYARYCGSLSLITKASFLQR